MDDQSVKYNKELKRVREFADAAVLLFRQEHRQRTKREFSEPSTTQYPKEYDAVQQIITKTSIDRISKIDTSVRAMLFLKSVRKSVFGQNNVEELNYILTEYQWEFGITAEYIWLKYYNNECDKTLRDARSYLDDQI